MSIGSWAVIDYRIQRESAADLLGEIRWPYARPVEEGLREALASGTSTIGDIATTPPSADLSAADVTAFFELRASPQPEINTQIAAAAAYLRTTELPTWRLSRLSLILSIQQLLARAVDFCRTHTPPSPPPSQTPRRSPPPPAPQGPPPLHSSPEVSGPPPPFPPRPPRWPI